MARNIEIKARLGAGGIEAVLPRARVLAGGQAPTELRQDDCFYRVPQGRLKLRRFADGSAELIHYQRADAPGARASDYVRAVVPDADGLHAALERACGCLGRLRKRRRLLFVGQTRVHLDEVEGLGDFIELEVVLREDQSDAEGAAIAEQLMRDLGLDGAPRIAGAYLDLLDLLRAP
jgi:adenylate cyclase class IV